MRRTFMVRERLWRRLRRAWVAQALGLVLLAACSRSSNPPSESTATTGATGISSSNSTVPSAKGGTTSNANANLGAATSASAASAHATSPIPRKTYKRVLHTGDSMVGGGLARALRPRYEAEGAKYFRDVWESGSLRDFSRSDRIAEKIKATHPDVVLLSLGANDVYEKDPEVLAPFIEKIAKMTGGVACYWIGPPLWKKEHERIIGTLKRHSAPCTFIDSSTTEMQRKKDGIHPDEKGGETWADAIWEPLHGMPVY